MATFDKKTWFWVLFAVISYLFFYIGGRYYLRENFVGTRFKNTREAVAQQIVRNM
jgi:hypothetical protein